MPSMIRIELRDAGVKRAVTQFPEAMRRAAEAAILEAAAFLEGAVVERTPVAHGFLAGSIFSELRGADAGEKIRGIVAVNPPADRYALPVETGRRPGRRPPMEAIVLWLRSSKMAAAVTALAQEIAVRRKRRRGYARAPQEEAERSLAFLIARKIGREGTRGAFMFRRAFEENRERVAAHIRGRLAAAARRLFGGT